MKKQSRGFQRSDRVAEQVRRDLADLIRTELKDPRVGMISLTAVELTPDYAHAKVFFTTLNSDHLADIERGLKRASGFLRRELGRRIHIHTLPELQVVLALRAIFQMHFDLRRLFSRRQTTAVVVDLSGREMVAGGHDGT